MEKCGVIAIYWCFGFEKIKSQKVLLEKAKLNLETKERLAEDLAEELKQEVSRRQNLNRKELTERYDQLIQRKAELLEKLENIGFHVEKVEDIKKNLKEMIKNAEICTDNIEAIIHHFQKKDIKRDFFEKELNLPVEFPDLLDIEISFKSLTYL